MTSARPWLKHRIRTELYRPGTKKITNTRSDKYPMRMLPIRMRMKMRLGLSMITRYQTAKPPPNQGAVDESCCIGRYRSRLKLFFLRGPFLHIHFRFSLFPFLFGKPSRPLFDMRGILHHGFFCLAPLIFVLQSPFSRIYLLFGKSAILQAW